MAAFDTKAEIEFLVFFEDSNEPKEINIKPENSTEIDNTNFHSNNSPPQCLGPKKIIKEELPERTDEKIYGEIDGDKLIDEHIPKEITTLETENLQTKTQNSDTEKKRKQKLLQIYENKRSRKESTQENNTDYLSNINKENCKQGSLISNPNCTHQDVDTSQLNPKVCNVPSAATVSIPTRNNEDRVDYEFKRRISNSLAAVSINMQLVMETYAYHRERNTPYDSYKKQKLIYFNDSYDTVVKLILPEEQNQKFISWFLHKTYQYSLTKPSRRKYSFDDYGILFKELLDWAKKKQDCNQVTKDTTQTSGRQENVQASRLAEPYCSHAQPILKKPGVYSTTKSDSICIFSAGSPGNEISINVDPKISPHLLRNTHNDFKKHEVSIRQSTATSSSVEFPQSQNPFQTHPEIRPDNIINTEASVIQTTKNSNLNLPGVQIPFQANPDTRLSNIKNNESSNEPRAQIPFENQTETEGVIKYKSLQELLQQPPQSLSLPSISETQSRFPKMSKYMQTTECVQQYSGNSDTIPKKINTSTGLLQTPLEMQYGNTTISQSQLLPSRALSSPGMLHQNQQSVNTAQKQTALAPSHDHRIRPQPPSYESWRRRTWVQQQAQGEYLNHQHIQPQYDLPTPVQQWNQVQHHSTTQSEYEQYQKIQGQIRQTQHRHPQYGQLLTRHPQSKTPQHLHPQIPVQSTAQTEVEKHLHVEKWHQGLNELYRERQTQQQSHKSAPRSTSTDSGFISPLNFNTSDQTVPQYFTFLMLFK